MADHTKSGELDDQSTSRRTFMQGTGAAAGAGALGMLAGCTGGEEGNEGGDEGGEGGEGGDEGGEGGSQEEVTVSFWTAFGAENTQTRDHYEESMQNFEDMNDGVSVDMQFISYGDMREQIVTAVEGGNAPDLGEGGSAGIEFYANDQLADHGKYIEEAEDLPDNWSDLNNESTQFRGEWWAGGAIRTDITLLGITTEYFKELGYETDDDLKTWSQFRQAVDEIDQEFPNVHAYEETGVPGDLESYWGQARTAYTGGTDPWFYDDMDAWEDPEEALMIGKEDATDGMIKNCIDLARTYSSSESAGRGDEEIPSLQLTGRVASYTYAIGNDTRYRQVKDDVTFGWDGEIHAMPIPKLDPDYGAEWDVPELEGIEGDHGGHGWSLEQEKQVFDTDNADVAWDLNHYDNANEDHVVPLIGKVYPSIPNYTPHIANIDEAYPDKSAFYQAELDAFDTYSEQYLTTGAAWDLWATDEIRWTTINETMSESIAGQHDIDEVIDVIVERTVDAAVEAEEQGG